MKTARSLLLSTFHTQEDEDDHVPPHNNATAAASDIIHRAEMFCLIFHFIKNYTKYV